MLEEGSAPVAAHETGTEAVLLGREMGGDERKDIQGDAVYANEGVPPFTNGRQRDRGILIKLTDLVETVATEGVSGSFLKIW